jgi:hypothetical protein
MDRPVASRIVRIFVIKNIALELVQMNFCSVIWSNSTSKDSFLLLLRYTLRQVLCC